MTSLYNCRCDYFEGILDEGRYGKSIRAKSYSKTDMIKKNRFDIASKQAIRDSCEVKRLFQKYQCNLEHSFYLMGYNEQDDSIKYDMQCKGFDLEQYNFTIASFQMNIMF